MFWTFKKTFTQAGKDAAYIKKFKDKEKEFRENGYEEIRQRTAYLKGEDVNTYAVRPQKPVKPSEPQKPVFSVGGWLWRATVKFFSIGFAKSKGYKQHLRKLR